MDPQLVLEEGELAADAEDFAPEDEGTVSQATRVPGFDGNRLLKSLLGSQFSADPQLVGGWSDVEGFLWKRYGLRNSSGDAHGQPEAFPTRVGLCKGPVSLSVVDLFNSVVESGTLPFDCDLSSDYEGVGGGFPHEPRSSVLVIRPHGAGYLITGAAHPWKILIEDPLTLIQIQREGWHLQGDGIVSNLVQNGLPFKVLYPYCQSGTPFYEHPGPVVHPDGRSPSYPDYLVYRLDVADFFKSHPHAHAAALCAGGILWRIAVDTLPLPFEYEIVRSFHPRACTEYTVDNQRYWSPKLSLEEEETIVGVYKWAGKSCRNKYRQTSVLTPARSQTER
jgi:hypothetical protein